MKTKSIVAAILTATVIASPSAYAGDVTANETDSGDYVPSPPHHPEPIPEVVVDDPREYPNVDVLPEPDEQLIAENPWVNSSTDPKVNDSSNDPTSQDNPEIWAVVDQSGNTVNTIVCDIDYCGSGWIPTQYDGFTPTQWARVVLQSARDPLTGENNGGHWGQYNFPSNVWTDIGSNGATYIIPTTYGESGACIENCPVIQDPLEGVVPEEGGEEVLLNNIESTEEITETQTRNSFVKATKTKGYFSFKEKVHKKKFVRSEKVWIIAKKNNIKKIWKFRVKNNGLVKITLPIEYIDWNISVKYKLKNTKRFSKNIILRI